MRITDLLSPDGIQLRATPADKSAAIAIGSVGGCSAGLAEKEEGVRSGPEHRKGGA